MSRNYKFNNSEGVYFVTFAVVYWIDVFIRDEYRNVLLDSWRYCIKNKGFEIYAWCIMPSHVHMIISSKEKNPAKTLGEMKSFTSTTLRKAIRENPVESRKEWMIWMMERAGLQNKDNQGFQFWQRHSNPIELITNHIMQQKLDYIHQNPVKAGFVDLPESWLYSSAKDYVGEKGLLEELLVLI